MTTTYSGNPADSDKDAVRFWIEDTAATFALTDEEIAYVLTIYPNPMAAAAACARALAAKYAKLVDKEVGDLKIKYSQRGTAYLALAERLEAQSGLVGLVPYGGGISIADMQAVDLDSDRPAPPIRIGQFDNPQAGRLDPDRDRWP